MGSNQKKYQLKIELLSDLCVADGGVYNSFLDIDICYDQYGFPFIPAKRLKGCLRECAVQLNDWGMEIPVFEIFGDWGESANGGNVRISNAILEKREEYVREITDHPHMIYHKQNVLNTFSYIRTQTAINYETGAADATSLRTMRVANKGLIFVATVYLDEEYQKAFENCYKILSRMGIARTRGIGEVRVISFKEDSQKKKEVYDYREGTTKLCYTIHLEEPVVCKSVAGGESHTQDYIDGGKIFGIVAGYLNQRNAFQDYIGQGESFFSNAYLAKDNIRLHEIPAYIFAIKNNSTEYVNKLFSTSKDEEDQNGNSLQLNGMKHCYTMIDSDGKLHKYDVCMQEQYHHSRPKDKSIGRALGEDNSDSKFYQISSICAAQDFKGYVVGTPDQIHKVYDALTEKEEYFIGYARNAEYGRVRIQVDELGKEETTEFMISDEIVVVLDAPAIVYNTHATYTTDTKDLLEEIYVNLGIEENEVNTYVCYVNYVTVGGYNVTWKARKPVVYAFGAGTAVHLKLKDKKQFEKDALYLLGERIQEGYGEARVYSLHDLPHNNWKIQKQNDEKARQEKMSLAGRELGGKICKKIYQSFIHSKSIEIVQKELNHLVCTEVRPTVSNMLLMCAENKTVKDVEYTVKERYEDKSNEKQDKGIYAQKIIELVKEQCRVKSKKDKSELVKEFEKQYRVSEIDDSDTDYLLLKNIVMELKYAIRAKETERQSEAKGGEANA